jgi:hypothetical protein
MADAPIVARLTAYYSQLRLPVGGVNEMDQRGSGIAPFSRRRALSTAEVRQIGLPHTLLTDINASS